MRRARSLHRCVAMAFLAAAGFGLGACEQMADLIPDSKKPLPGERKLLFPEGVPGVTQGVPPELMRGNQQVQGQTAPGQTGAPADPQAQQQPAEQQQAEEKPKPKPKPKVQRTVRQQPRQEPQPEPAQPQQPQQQQTSPWPAPQQQPTQPSPWPSAPAPGTFTR